MHLSTMLEMIEGGLGDRVLVGERSGALTGAELVDRARRGAVTLEHATALVYVGENDPLVPILLLAAAWAGVPYVPLNYRLNDSQLLALIARQPGALVVADTGGARRLAAAAVPDVVELSGWSEQARTAAPITGPATDDDAVAVVLYTSGTTSEPKAALLRHRHLMSYLLGTVEFAGAGEDEAALVSVPPYHIAGVSNVVSNFYAGRRLITISQFSPDAWLDVARAEQVTHAMVVPTMLARIVDAIEAGSHTPTTLRSLSYGGSKIATTVVQRALRAFPDTAFVNAYGLTETASTIAVLGPDDHRAALDTTDDAERRRLTSAGRVLASVEVDIRDELGVSVPQGASGVIYVRGEQISGEYATGSSLDGDGWFCTRDAGFLDEAGYLFIDGRLDDTIIRGGENIAPAEIENALHTHPAVADVCVVGLPDDEWGQRIVAVVVARGGFEVTSDELREHVRAQLRGSKTPEDVRFTDELPRTPTGKVVRRTVVEQLISEGISEA